MSVSLARILLVEDEPGVVLVVSDLLRAEGHAVETAGDGITGRGRAEGEHFDLLILDVMLPGLGGFEICRAVRAGGFGGAVLMLTARGEVRDRVGGLGVGADDYLVKPFDPDELVARVHALLRRVRRPLPPPGAHNHFKFGSLTLDFARGEFAKGGATFSLTPKEAELLHLLVRHSGEGLDRQTMLREVWREQPFITPRTVDVHIAWLRQKIEDQPQSPRHITTLRGEGYRFNLDNGI